LSCANIQLYENLQAVVRLYIQHEAPLNLAFQLLVQFLFFPKPLEKSFTLKATKA
jgi:hypothetical protein